MTDASGCEHLGIIEYPVPILRATPELLRQTRQRLHDPDFRDVTVVDFTDLAQGCKTYGEFVDKMALTVFDDLEYYGLALCGPRKKVTDRQSAPAQRQLLIAPHMLNSVQESPRRERVGILRLADLPMRAGHAEKNLVLLPARHGKGYDEFNGTRIPVGDESQVPRLCLPGLLPPMLADDD